MNWDSFRHILAVSRAGTLSAAARRMGVDQTTVSRRLAAAEDSLGTRLFERVDGHLHPTPAGDRAIREATRMEEAEADLRVHLSHESEMPRGSVRVTSVPILINRILIPAIPVFHRACPGVTLDLIPEARTLSLTRREADVAIRLSRPRQDAAAVMRRIGSLPFAAYGPTAGPVAEDLPWIRYSDALQHLPQAQWIEDRIAAGDPGSAALTVEDADTALTGVAQGLGRSLLPCSIADQDNRLLRLSSEVAVSREIWMMTYSDLRHTRRIEAVTNWLIDVVSGHSNLDRWTDERE